MKRKIIMFKSSLSMFKSSLSLKILFLSLILSNLSSLRLNAMEYNRESYERINNNVIQLNLKSNSELLDKNGYYRIFHPNEQQLWFDWNQELKFGATHEIFSQLLANELTLLRQDERYVSRHEWQHFQKFQLAIHGLGLLLSAVPFLSMLATESVNYGILLGSEIGHVVHATAHMAEAGTYVFNEQERCENADKLCRQPWNFELLSSVFSLLVTDRLSVELALLRPERVADFAQHVATELKKALHEIPLPPVSRFLREGYSVDQYTIMVAYLAIKWVFDAKLVSTLHQFSEFYGDLAESPEHEVCQNRLKLQSLLRSIVQLDQYSSTDRTERDCLIGYSCREALACAQFSWTFSTEPAGFEMICSLTEQQYQNLDYIPEELDLDAILDRSILSQNVHLKFDIISRYFSSSCCPQCFESVPNFVRNLRVILLRSQLDSLKVHLKKPLNTIIKWKSNSQFKALADADLIGNFSTYSLLASKGPLAGMIAERASYNRWFEEDVEDE